MDIEDAGAGSVAAAERGNSTPLSLSSGPSLRRRPSRMTARTTAEASASVRAAAEAATGGLVADDGTLYVPGLATIYVRTWGCSHNISDGEYMAGLLNEYGFTVTGK